MHYTILQFVGLFLLMLAGVLGHFSKRKFKGQTSHDIISYFKTNLVDTIAAVTGSIIAFVVLAWLHKLDPMTAIGAGYIADSIFNKAEEKINQVL